MRRHGGSQLSRMAASLDKCFCRSLDTSDAQVPINSRQITGLYSILLLVWGVTNLPMFCSRHIEISSWKKPVEVVPPSWEWDWVLSATINKTKPFWPAPQQVLWNFALVLYHMPKVSVRCPVWCDCLLMTAVKVAALSTFPTTRCRKVSKWDIKVHSPSDIL